MSNTEKADDINVVEEDLKKWQDDTGPIRDDLSESARVRRASKRRAGGIGDTDIVEDVEAVEEDLHIAEEGGIKLEAFNLRVRKP